MQTQREKRLNKDIIIQIIRWERPFGCPDYEALKSFKLRELNDVLKVHIYEKRKRTRNHGG